MVILFNMLIYRKLASMRGSMSSKTKEIHRQLSNVLKWQVCSIFYIKRIFIVAILGTGSICNLRYTFDLCLRPMCFRCSDSWEGYNFDSSSDVDPSNEPPFNINFCKAIQNSLYSNCCGKMSLSRKIYKRHSNYLWKQFYGFSSKKHFFKVQRNSSWSLF